MKKENPRTRTRAPPQTEGNAKSGDGAPSPEPPTIIKALFIFAAIVAVLVALVVAFLIIGLLTLLLNTTVGFIIGAVIVLLYIVGMMILIGSSIYEWLKDKVTGRKR